MKKCQEMSNYLVKKKENVDERGELSLVCLNDSVLLHVFSFLDWIDSIHFAETCMRLKQLNFWKYHKHREFNLSEYLEKGQIPLKHVLIRMDHTLKYCQHCQIRSIKILWKNV